MRAKNILITLILATALFIIFKEVVGKYISKKLDGTGGVPPVPDINNTEPPLTVTSPGQPDTASNSGDSTVETVSPISNASGPVADNMIQQDIQADNGNKIAMQVEDNRYINDMPYIMPATIFTRYDIPLATKDLTVSDLMN